MDYTNYYDIRNSLDSKSQSQSQWLLFILWEARKFNHSKIKHDGHRGWMEMHVIARSQAGFRASARKDELIKFKHVPIICEKIKVGGKMKHYYALDCDPELFDWEEIITNWNKWKFEEK